MIHDELSTYVPIYSKIRKWCALKWLGSEETIRAKNLASIMIDLTNEEDKKKFLELGMVTLFNNRCTITDYEEQTQIYPCGKCGMLSHRTLSCHTPRCLKCGSKEHTDGDHPADKNSRCINCKENHTSDYKDCNARRNRMGLKPIPKKPRAQTNRETTNTEPSQSKRKGKNKEQTQEMPETTQLERGLTDRELSTILSMQHTNESHKNTTARFIHTRSMKKANNTTSSTQQSGPKDMEIVDDSQHAN